MTVLHPASMTPGADKQVLAAELGVAHALGISLKVVGLDANLLGQTSGLVESMERSASTSFSIFPFDQQAPLVDLHPGLLVDFVVGVQPARQLPQVLAGVIEIDDLHRAREMQLGQIPDPFGAVAQDDFLFRAAPAALPGFQVDPFAKLFGESRWLRCKWWNPDRGWGSPPCPRWSG